MMRLQHGCDRKRAADDSLGGLRLFLLRLSGCGGVRRADNH